MQHIIDAVSEVVSQFGGRTIFDTAENAGVKVWYRPLGSLKGFYLCENGVRYIVINEELDEMLRQAVCAHELGHDTLHRELSAGGIRENTMFLSGNKTEREANLFAAEILVSNRSLLNELSFNSDVNSAAFELGVPPELVQLKLELMNYEGYSFNLTETKSNFLK